MEWLDRARHPEEVVFLGVLSALYKGLFQRNVIYWPVVFGLAYFGVPTIVRLGVAFPLLIPPPLTQHVHPG